MSQRRKIFFVSDGTGISAQMLGHSLLSQFDQIEFSEITIPFVDNMERAEECRTRIEQEVAAGNGRPIVFSTLVNPELRRILCSSGALCLDLFETFIGPLEAGLGEHSTYSIGRSHSARDVRGYTARIEAVNFALNHDDGASDADLDQADVILTGVSRSGKTPTSLYLAMQFGVKAANCPLIPEDLQRRQLPSPLRTRISKLFGLTISPERLQEIRQSRRPDSKYADIENCRYEVAQAETLMRNEGIKWIDSTSRSIEEIATTILRELRIERHLY